ncbi:MAG TPA: zinc ribbon domain-containing protein [Ktedonobacteraceae bacterium]|nr:zinc ribbon domain-containing protein [Ktedonobacteraceae bacterium]
MNPHIVFLFANAGTGGTTNILSTLQNLTGPLIGCTAAFVVAFWASLVVWTFRDIRARTQDFLSQVLATVLVAVFPFVGVFIYMVLRPRQTLAEIYERQLEEESLLAEMTERQTCSNCHARIETDFQVCPSCGQKLKRSCPKCERLLELRWTFCPYCASNLTGGMPPNMPGMPPSMSGMGMPGGGPPPSQVPMGGQRY